MIHKFLCYYHNMSWFYLFIATIFEMGWPLGLKLAYITPHKVMWIIVTIIATSLSGVFLFLAQKEIPIGTAYAIWTGIGMAGTFIIGILFFNDSYSFLRFLGVFFILSGVIILKLCH